MKSTIKRETCFKTVLIPILHLFIRSSIHKKEGTGLELNKEVINRNEMKCALCAHYYTNLAYLSMDLVSVAAMKPYSVDEMASALTSGILDVLGYASIYFHATVKRSLNEDSVY